MTASLHAIPQLVTLRFLDSLLEGVCIAVFAAIVLRFARRQSSAVRFAICFSALIAIAVLPFLRPSPATTGSGHAAIALPQSWALYFFTIWGFIALCGLLRLGRALVRLYSIRKSCLPLDTRGLDPLLQRTLAAHAIKRHYTLCTSNRVRIPTAIGLLKPAIIIPDWVMQDLSADELNHIVLHELAHLRRWDDWTNLAQQFVKALFFFHPAVWWIEKRIALEREMACDDAVVAATSSPRAYAECLARLAERSFVRQSLALAQSALGKLRHTSLRVAQILCVDRPANVTRSWKPAASLVVSFAVILGVVVSRTPEFVAFQDSSPAHISTAAVPTDSSIVPALNLAHPARFTVPSVTATRTIPAKLNIRPQHRNQPAHLAKLNPPSPAPLATRIHLTTFHDDAVPFTERLFFVVDDTTGISGQQVYRIELWRVIVFHPVDDSATHAPPKQT